MRVRVSSLVTEMMFWWRIRVRVRARGNLDQAVEGDHIGFDPRGEHAAQHLAEVLREAGGVGVEWHVG